MKLLQPAQNRNNRASEVARDILRQEEMRKLIKQTNIDLAKAEADFNNALAGQRARWALEELEHTKEVERMQKEIASLNAQREKAMEPISILESRAEKLMQEAQQTLGESAHIKQENERMAEILEDKLDDVGHREQNVIMAEKKIRAEREGIESQRASIKLTSENLNKGIADFIAFREATMAEIKEEKNNIIKEQMSIESEKAAIRVERKNIKDEWRKIKDQRETLERAMRRISPQNIDPKNV